MYYYLPIISKYNFHISILLWYYSVFDENSRGCFSETRLQNRVYEKIFARAF